MYSMPHHHLKMTMFCFRNSLAVSILKKGSYHIKSIQTRYVGSHRYDSEAFFIVPINGLKNYGTKKADGFIVEISSWLRQSKISSPYNMYIVVVNIVTPKLVFSSCTKYNCSLKVVPFNLLTKFILFSSVVNLSSSFVGRQMRSYVLGFGQHSITKRFLIGYSIMLVWFCWSMLYI
jgi:hypothetical protein